MEKISVFITLLFLVGCSRPVDERLAPTSTDTAQLRNQIESLRQRLDFIESRPRSNLDSSNLVTQVDFTTFDEHLRTFLTELSSNLDAVTADVAGLKFREGLRDESRWVPVDPTASGYQKIETGVLPLLLVVKDVSPYIDGYKFNLEIGNPYSANFNGLKIDSRWHISPVVSNNVFVNLTSYNASVKTNSFESSVTLPGGGWAKIEIPIVPATADEVRNVEMKFSASRLELRNTADSK